MAANEEEIKIRERLVSLETKLDFLSDLLKEIKKGLKDTPSKEDYDDLVTVIDKLEKRLSRVENTQTNQLIKVGVLGGILGMIGGMLIKFLTH